VTFHGTPEPSPAVAVTIGHQAIQVEATMMMTIWLGAGLVICGILYMALATIFRGGLSDPHLSSTRNETLEPARPGLRFLGLKMNWPGLLLIAIGAVLLLSGG
jgi:hypothetical protein